MAKAQITTPEGIKIRLEGSANEVAEVIKDLKKSSSQESPLGGKSKGATRGGKLTRLVGALKSKGFFRQKRGLAAIRSALEELGHHYPVTTLSGVMLDQVRRRNLRRLKENKRWVYAE